LGREGRVKLRRMMLFDGDQHKDYPGRKPLVGEFEMAGQEIVIINVHLISKLKDEPYYSQNFPFNRKSETRRLEQVLSIKSYVRELLQSNPELKLIVAGDFNDYAENEPGESVTPIDALTDKGLLTRLPRSGQFSYVFLGNAQAIDHALLSTMLTPHLSGFEYLNFNSPFSEVFAEDSADYRRSSDHDPLVLDFSF